MFNKRFTLLIYSTITYSDGALPRADYVFSPALTVVAKNVNIRGSGYYKTSRSGTEGPTLAPVEV
jgi:hypothetical protein